MSAPLVQVQLSEASQKILRELQVLPNTMATAVAAAMDYENQLTISAIIRLRLTGRGPFPPEQGKLGVVTGLLRRSVRATPARFIGRTVTSSIGTNVKYAAVHEFGGTFTRTVQPGSVRLRTDRRGELLRQPGGRLAIFAKKTHKSAREVSFAGGRSYVIRMPARAPIQRGLAERLPNYVTAIDRAIQRTAPK